MLRHSNLYDPIKIPVVQTKIDFSRYIEIHQNQTRPTAAGYVAGIKAKFYEANSKAKPENLDKVWEFVAPKIENNTGLAEFINDYHGAESKYFFPWLINVFKSPSTALEISYGAGPDVNGDWHEDILDTNDPIVHFIYNNPMFAYNRERQLRIADLASTVYDCTSGHSSKKSKIVDFDAGYMAWLRRHGCGYAPWVDIFAFDKDKTINLEDILFRDPRKSEVHFPVQFKQEDFIEHLADPNCKDADLIILGNTPIHLENFFDKIVPAIHTLLKPMGVFFFDLPENPAIVIDLVEKARLDLWEKGMQFSSEYAVDTYNRIPSGVMITFQKV